MDDAGVAEGLDEKVKRLRLGRDGVVSGCALGLAEFGGGIMLIAEDCSSSRVWDGRVISVLWVRSQLSSNEVWLVAWSETWESSLKITIDFSRLLDGSHPSKSGKSRRVSSMESSENRNVSLLVLTGLLLALGRGKNLLFLGDPSFSSCSSHRRAFLTGLTCGSDWGAARGEATAKSDIVAWAGLLATRASMVEMGSVRRL
jgi:hypothetical protein